MDINSTTENLSEQFQYLHQLWRLSNCQAETPVSIWKIARALNISGRGAENHAAVLREYQLLYYTSLDGDVALTPLGVSEVDAARKNPNAGTHYFPSIKTMKLRFSRGHHLFDQEVLSRHPLSNSDLTSSDEQLRDIELPSAQAATELSTIKPKTAEPAANQPGNILEFLGCELDDLLAELGSQIDNIEKRQVPGSSPSHSVPNKSFLPTSKSTGDLRTRTRATSLPQNNAKQHSRGDRIKQGHSKSTRAPSLLFNGSWTSNKRNTSYLSKQNASHGFANAEQVVRPSAKPKAEPSIRQNNQQEDKTDKASKQAHWPDSQWADSQWPSPKLPSPKLPESIDRLEQLITKNKSTPNSETLYVDLEQVNQMLFAVDDRGTAPN